MRAVGVLNIERCHLVVADCGELHRLLVGRESGARHCRGSLDIDIAIARRLRVGGVALTMMRAKFEELEK